MSRTSSTDDEAFIRAIVDSPADDALRLVYADWLDERGDPRGAYLRSEIRAIRDASFELGALEVGSDQIWVARVSRPPLGVCVARCDLFDDELPDLPFEWSAKARETFRSFPAQYAAFLMTHDGGLCNQYDYTPDFETIEKLVLRPPWSFCESAYLASWAVPSFLPLAELTEEEGPMLLVSKRPRDWGAVFAVPNVRAWFDRELSNHEVHLVAPSLGHYLHSVQRNVNSL